ncbi:hypothetical protein P3T76_012123 [Phytophthora citrophthora]|uniref:DUF4211 domain-containing protein n=1 Tax=Phytophthora citrophthora TaxID=4793 RepID=A0AAD9G650_9STRA|nr:hypothetical protein P3T76_012123 [Phytophthora citrophthora]
MTERKEVVIDGDSTEDDEVTIITPEARKRRRRSNILTFQDEEEDEQESKAEEVDKIPASSGPQRQQQLVLNPNGVSLQSMTLRTPTPTRRSRRNMHQLSISAAVERGDRGRRQQEAGEKDAEEEEDDDVRIIQPASASSVTSSGRKRRPAIVDSDEEMEPNQKQEQESDNEQKVELEDTSSASRRSSRIQHKRKEKDASARKLDYPMLGNCLDNLQNLGPHYKGGDGDDDDDGDYQESEPEEPSPPPKKKRRSLPRVGDRDSREKVYANAGDDVDDFICADDEIEYMNDDEQAVLSVDSSDGEMGEEDAEELTAMLAAGRSREVNEWFEIYMEYLEECIIDPDFENKMHRKRSKAKHQLYQQAINRIERKLCSCRDSVRSGVAWPEEMVYALQHASLFRSHKVHPENDCDACNRHQGAATYHVELAGYTCDATKLYSNNWMRQYVRLPLTGWLLIWTNVLSLCCAISLKEAVKEARPVQVSFELGSVCHARTLAYWQMLHAKQFWCILIDAKMKQCADSSGRIAEAYREEFFKKEFGRYKRIVGLVEKFADDSKRIAYLMPNAWKKITRRNVTSSFLPLAARTSPHGKGSPRRGTLDSFVGESEEEETEDEEETMEKIEEEKRIASVENNNDDLATDEEDETKDVEVISPERTPRCESKRERKLQLTTKERKAETQQVKEEKDIDDLMCLVCGACQRNAGIVHGLYLHVYCCYACAKRQLRMKCGCMVCNRPIDRVLRLLPLTVDARNAIRNQQQQQLNNVG